MAFFYFVALEKHNGEYKSFLQIFIDWISQRTPESVLCFKGKLYLMCTDDRHVDEHLDHHLEIDFSAKDNDLSISIKAFHVKKVLFPEKTHSESHYVESHDELFRVDITCRGIISEVTSIEVVRLNFSLMGWEKVNSFGDHVLFLGDYTTACSSAAELGFTCGCLYYICDRTLHKFEIESSGITVILPGLLPRKTLYCMHWVIMPANAHQGVENGKDDKNDYLMVRETSTTMVVNYDSQGGKCNAGDVEVASNWNILNQDIVELIASNYLRGSDYKHFRSVCKENRAIMPKVQPTSYLSPWLLFSRDHSDTIYSVVNPMYNNVNYAMNYLSDIKGSTIRFQKGGWLLLTREENIFFYNPFTRETVELPDLNKGSYCYSVVSCSSFPTASDCIVFAMDYRTDGFYIDFIRRGEAHWSSHIFDTGNVVRCEPFLDTAIFCDGDFFCVNCNGTVGVFSAKDNSWKVEKPHKNHAFYGGFLVECDGDVLIVKLESPISIFRLNFSEMKWVNVESLGKHVLFIGHTSCVSAVAPDSHMKNKIYFPRLYLKDGGVVFYSLETCSYHCFGRQHSAEDLPDTEGWFRNCTWIEPNRSMSTTEELDWLKTTI